MDRLILHRSTWQSLNGPFLYSAKSANATCQPQLHVKDQIDVEEPKKKKLHCIGLGSHKVNEGTEQSAEFQDNNGFPGNLCYRSTGILHQRSRWKLHLRNKAHCQARFTELETQELQVNHCRLSTEISAPVGPKVLLTEEITAHRFRKLWSMPWIDQNDTVIWIALFGRSGAVVAKYGDKSVYFDLEDLGNTTGQWDLYGSDAPSPYNSLQVS